MIIIAEIVDFDDTVIDQICDFMHSISNGRLIYSYSYGDTASGNSESIRIDFSRQEVLINKKRVSLTKLEFELLAYLAKSPERVFTYQQIYEAVWDEPYACEKGTIMTHIRHLREKIEANPHQPQYIENVRGIGYRFRKHK